MKVQISVIQKDTVMSKMKEEYLKKNPPLTPEQLKEKEVERIVKGLTEEEQSPRLVVMPEINIDDFSIPVDFYFRLSEVRSIYRTPPDAQGKTSMMIVVGTIEYQAFYDEEQFTTIANYLNSLD